MFKKLQELKLEYVKKIINKYREYEAEEFINYILSKFNIIDKISIKSSFEKTLVSGSGYYIALNVSISDDMKIYFSLENCYQLDTRSKFGFRICVYKKTPAKVIDSYIYLKANKDNFTRIINMINKSIELIESLPLPVLEEIHLDNKKTITQIKGDCIWQKNSDSHSNILN